MTRLSARRADAVITDAECTKRDVIELLGVSADKITVIPLAAAEHYHDLRDTPQGRTEIKAIRQKYHLPDQLLYLGTLEPRKNIPALLRGYAEFLKTAGVEAPFLVIAGAKGWMYEEIFRQVEALKLTEQTEALFNWDRLYIGGGNSRKLEMKARPEVTLIENEQGLTGGIALWQVAN